ncbi:MAG: hypothetical protein OEV49_15550 [candidate division Zixibacteria bacterium]|nr:hypothetical protein [candidate division Zixibacteria bacterium]MDH3938498.1 hypothetical protein [candidate division Zixibacteria bacterium]MDH4032750.1 hypothetical protein [candidate division Zixibacteria bacterium]
MIVKLSLVLLVLGLFFTGEVHAQAQDKKAEAQVKAMEMMKSMGLPGGGTGEQVEALNWRELAKLLPKSIGDLEAGKIDGGTFNFDGAAAGMAGYGGTDDKTAQSAETPSMSYSTVERSYTKQLDKGQKKITLRVMDSGMVKMMLAAFFSAVEYDTPEGMLKSTEISGYPAKVMLQFNDDMDVEQTQFMVLVSERILVQVEGNQHVSQDEVKAVASDFPYNKLDKSATTKVTEAIGK